MCKNKLLKKLILVYFVLLHSHLLYASSGNVSLKSEINLEPACLINQKNTLQGSNLNKLGSLNFDDQYSNFNLTSTTLSNESNNAIQVLCPEGSNVKVLFNAGTNANHVPNQFAANYQRAMSNGNGDYIAYQIYENSKSGKVLTPQTSIDFLGGSEYTIRLYAEAVNTRVLQKGEYTDQITITINF